METFGLAITSNLGQEGLINRIENDIIIQLVLMVLIFCVFYILMFNLFEFDNWYQNIPGLFSPGRLMDKNSIHCYQYRSCLFLR